MNKLLIFTCFALLFGCGSTTSIVNSWKDPDATPEDARFSKILVSVLSTNESSRRIAEEHLASINPIFIPSYSIIKEELADDPDRLKTTLLEQGFDGILLLRLMDKDKNQTYVPGTNRGQRYWGRYGYYWDRYYEPGYYQENTNYTIETSLYSLTKDKLLWSGTSTTVNPTSIEKTVNDILKKSYKQMQKDGLIQSKS